jgi:hypothetical protein
VDETPSAPVNAADALLSAVRLGLDHPDRALPWRLALVATEDLSLAGRPAWSDLRDRFVAGR